MKIRSGFVSNSSSSSFVCEICGEEMSGMDLTLSEADMSRCVNGHTICQEHKLDSSLITVEKKRNWLKEMIESSSWYNKRYSKYLEYDDEDFDEWFDDEMTDDFEDDGSPSATCPICQFQTLTDEDVSAYYLLSNHLTKETFAQQMKERFQTYENFDKWLKEKLDENQK